MQGKTVLITGATNGIGEAAARALARLGANLVLIGRNQAKTQAVAEALRRQAAAGGTIETIVADLGNLADVRRAAAEFLARHDRLDVLMNNAGAVNMERSRTADGYETTFAVNHLAYFLLTQLLLDVLLRSAPSRIVNVSSEAHRLGRMHWDDLMMEREYSGIAAYAQSKLANILFTYELARRLEGTGVTANCLHPGTIASGFGRNGPGLYPKLVRLMAPLLPGPERGARTQVYLSTSPDVAKVTGTYWKSRKPIRSSKASYDREAARRLWEVSEQLTGLAPRPSAPLRA